MTVTHGSLSIDWLGYATARLAVDGGPTVYTDPGRYGVLDGYRAADGDVVLVTHDHHYDPDGIERVAAPDATVLVHEAVDADRIDRVDLGPEDLPVDVRRIGTDATVDLLDGTVEVATTPAHNDPEGPRAGPDGSVSHPPGSGCGFRLAVDGHAVFWPGDTDLLEAFGDVEATVLLANIGGSVVMDRHEAATLATWLRPDLVVPIHYDTIPLLEADEEAFVLDVAARGIPVALDG